MLIRLRHAERLDGLKLRLDFDDGTAVVANFEPLIYRGGLFERLKNPEYFRRFSIVRDGRALEWPDELDFCADALWLEHSASSESLVAADPIVTAVEPEIKGASE